MNASRFRQPICSTMFSGMAARRLECQGLLPSSHQCLVGPEMSSLKGKPSQVYAYTVSACDDFHGVLSVGRTRGRPDYGAELYDETYNSKSNTVEAHSPLILLVSAAGPPRRRNDS